MGVAAFARRACGLPLHCDPVDVLHGRLRPSYRVGSKTFARVEWATAALLFVVVAQTVWWHWTRDWDQVAATQARREAALRRQLADYKPTLDFLGRLENPRIYQVGMEAALYYAPHPILGDHFGPWRYRDFMTLLSPQLAARLEQANIDVLVARRRYIGAQLQWPEFAQCFAELFQDSEFSVYRVQPVLSCDGRTDRCCIPEPLKGFVIGPMQPAKD